MQNVIDLENKDNIYKDIVYRVHQSPAGRLMTICTGVSTALCCAMSSNTVSNSLGV